MAYTKTTFNIALLFVSVMWGYAGFRGGRFVEAYATRVIAVEHSCGMYDARSGEFGWVKPVTAEDAFLPSGELIAPGIQLKGKSGK